MPGNASFWPEHKRRECGRLLAPARHARMFSSEQVRCATETLPRLLRARGRGGARSVALLKIDVEHHEVEVLRGLRTEEDWAAVDAVVVETHTRALAARVLAILRRHYEVTGARADDELPEHAIVFAHVNRHQRE